MQVIKYKWNNFEPFLVIAGHEKIRLFGSALHATIGEKRCAGFFLDGRHVECKEKPKLDYGSQCSRCMERDGFALCMRCTGESCINEKRRKNCAEEQYIIYLAAFNSILKVGISFEGRFIERLVEQGADFGAIVGRVRGGMNVRKIEQEISTTLNIVDRVRGNDKKRMLFCNPDVAMLNIKAAIRKLNQNFSRYMIPPQIFDLRSYYRLQNVLLEPKEFSVLQDSRLEGNVVAAKGNIIVIENNGFSSVNAHELLGREIEFQQGPCPE